MSDYLRSPLGYLNGTTNTNEYVGQVLEINNVKLRVTRLLAEGGWALVYAVEDINTGKEYALKRLIAFDQDANNIIRQEIETLKRLSGHPNIIQYLYAQCIERDGGKGYEYLLVTEFCPGGTVADILRSLSANSLSVAQICKIAYQATKAVHHMHNLQPEPLIHRDIKLENFLIGNDGMVKLCDFGSVSSQQILPNPSWNAQKRGMLEDQIAKFTTPMYRAPEMWDTWNNEPIGPPADCWALGCIIYALITLKHPFLDGNKLAILNSKYPALPSNPKLSCFYDIVKGCLEVSPVRRLSTSMILERLAAIAESNNFDPREPPKVKVATKAPPPRPIPPPSTPMPPPRPSPPVNASAPKSASVQPTTAKTTIAQTTGLFSSLKGGADSILRNIKDTSSKMMHSMQQSMARTELDANYLTSRILVMPYPVDGLESAYRANHIQDVKAFLQTRHPPPARIQLYNLSRGRPNVTRLPGRHIDCSFAYASADSNAPLLSALYQICQDIYRYLNADFNHVVVLYCNDGLRASATIACTLLIYARAFTTSEEAIAMFTTRRQPPQFQPSELRSITYMSMLSTEVQPHTKPLVLHCLVIQPVPLFTRAKDGCRPYIDIYSNGALVFSTKRPEYEDMRLFGIMDGKISLPLGNVIVRGDVTIVIFHARQQLGRIIGIKIASLHFHTGYIPLTETALTFKKKELDDAPEIGGNFSVTLNITVTEENSKMARIPAPWEAESRIEVEPDPLFGSTLEMEETIQSFLISKVDENKKDTILSQKIEAPTTPNVQQEDLERTTQNVEEKAKEESVLQEADLLNLGMPDISTLNTSQSAVNPGLDIFSSSSQKENDLLEGFGMFAKQEHTNPASDLVQDDLLFGHDRLTKNDNKSDNLNDLVFNENQATNNKQNLNDLFDPFRETTPINNLLGGIQNPKPNNGKTPTVEENFPRNSSVPNFAAHNKDPFANLASSLGAGLNSSWNGTPKNSNTPQSASPAPASTPIHSSPNTQRNATNNINSADNSAAANKSGKTGGDAFEDLLGSQGYNFFSSRKAEKDSPKTINQMRKVEAAKNMDPDHLKIAEWTEGKKGNLRALLCSMHTVLWSEADRWQRCEMHQLVTAADVKKAYRRACLAVHPDKQAGTANEKLAKLIFMELNNAWSTFENDASQQNLFS